MPGAFKIVPGLGDALHEAMKKISGVEEIAPAAEGLTIFIIRDALKKKLRDYLGIFPNMGGGGLPNSQNFCKFTKSFLVCQIHFEVLKHVLHTGGGNI